MQTNFEGNDYQRAKWDQAPAEIGFRRLGLYSVGVRSRDSQMNDSILSIENLDSSVNQSPCFVLCQ